MKTTTATKGEAIITMNDLVEKITEAAQHYERKEYSQCAASLTVGVSLALARAIRDVTLDMIIQAVDL